MFIYRRETTTTNVATLMYRRKKREFISPKTDIVLVPHEQYYALFFELKSVLLLKTKLELAFLQYSELL